MKKTEFVIISGEDVIGIGEKPEEAVENARKKLAGMMPECCPEYGYMYKRTGYVDIGRVLTVSYHPDKKD